jgi:hypothetical protein
MDYREERTFTIELALSATFGEDYAGEEDGYEWHRRFDEAVRPKIAQAVIAALLADGWRVTPTARGHAESERLELRVERIVR